MVGIKQTLAVNGVELSTPNPVRKQESRVAICTKNEKGDEWFASNVSIAFIHLWQQHGK